MAKACASCGSKLSLVQKLAGLSLCSKCAAEEKRARDAAGQEYEKLLAQIVRSPLAVSQVESQLHALRQRAALSDGETQMLHRKFVRSYLEEALEDEYLTEEEENRLNDVIRVLGIDQDTFDRDFDDLKARLFVARVNDGRIPTLANPRIVLKKNEVAHLEVSAELLKEVMVREWRGGYSGFSFRIAKGIRYHTGGARGRSVVVGTRLEAVDKGVLTVTSQRAVYLGLGQSVEMPYPKLLNVNVFDDGIQFHLSNRKSPPLFRLKRGLGHVVAATINAACQQSMT